MGQAVDSINVVISQSNAALLLPGFGEPMILSPHSHYTDRLRHYSSNAAGLAQMVSDGFSTAESAYLAASAICAQSPAPVRFAVGRLANKPTQAYDITPTAAGGAGVVYTIAIDGISYSYTSVGADSVATIVTGLVAAMAAVPGVTVTNTNPTVHCVATVAGAFHSIQMLDSAGAPSSTARANLSCAQTHADPGVAADLTAIALFDNTWYGILNSFDSKLMAAAIAGWAQSNQKLYIACSVDDAILGSGSTDLASNIKTSAYTRTAVLYKSENKSHAHAAWMAAKFPLPAGSENWAYATLAGIPADTLSETEKGNACGIPTSGTQGKYASIYETIFGKNVTEFGQVGSGSWLDVTRGVDAFVVDIMGRIFTDLSGPNKIPYSDKGTAVLVRDVKASIAFYTSPPQNFLAESPAPSVTVPAVATLSGGQRASRVLPSLNFSVNLAGALNGVTINGTVLT